MQLLAGFFGAGIAGLRLSDRLKPTLLLSKLAIVLRGALADLFRCPAGTADRNPFAVEAGAQLVELGLFRFLLGCQVADRYPLLIEGGNLLSAALA